MDLRLNLVWVLFVVSSLNLKFWDLRGCSFVQQGETCFSIRHQLVIKYWILQQMKWYCFFDFILEKILNTFKCQSLAMTGSLSHVIFGEYIEHLIFGFASAGWENSFCGILLRGTGENKNPENLWSFWCKLLSRSRRNDQAEAHNSRGVFVTGLLLCSFAYRKETYTCLSVIFIMAIYMCIYIYS